jgi:RsiW-degrading membrane proteinase PrsW (M82 family)
MSAWHYAISIPLSVVPALALLWLFARLDRARPVPRRALYATMALGALACGPAALVEWLEHAVLGDAALVGSRFVDAFLIAAFTEESLKLLVVLGYPFRRSVFEEVIDGVVYTVAASLGFGLLENLAFSASDVGTALARAITAVPMHAVASGVMGYFVGRARFVSQNGAFPLAMAGLFFAVLVHGAYDWAVYNRGTAWFAQSTAVLVAGGALLAWLVRHALRLDESMLGRQSLVALTQSWPTDVTQTIVPAVTRAARPTTAEADSTGTSS